MKLSERVLCVVGLHDWAQWQDGHIYMVTRRNDDLLAGISENVPYWIPDGRVMQQTRACQSCGKKQSREVAI